MQIERSSATDRAEGLHKQCTGLYRDYEMSQKSLQKKVHYDDDHYDV